MKLKALNIKQQWHFYYKYTKKNGDIKVVPVYFNSTIKIVINFEYNLDKSFQDFLYRTNN